ncbi:MAG: tetratricopeptide repeat protein [Phycisphaeraceae bacterium]|nr:MAG: tetratricopeptide repeat protein [Phycisphaeraceae bacterium]
MMRTITHWMTGTLVLACVLAQTSEARAQQSDRPAEATSLFGEPLLRPEIEPERKARLLDDLADAQAEHERNPESEQAAIWVGRRLGYLGRFNEAVEVFTRALTRHTHSHHLLRHRGHRYITLRQFDRAIDDLRRASMLVEGLPDEVEPDGAPNPAGIPRSTIQTNIWYHLALAHYLKGENERALDAWRRCLDLSKNDDMRVATLNWLILTQRRLGMHDEARRALQDVHTDMDVIENVGYHRLLLFYKGELELGDLLDPEADDSVQLSTIGYGVGAWLLAEGRRDAAMQLFGQVRETPTWPAFGYIAAEADLHRLGGNRR